MLAASGRERKHRGRRSHGKRCSLCGTGLARSDGCIREALLRLFEGVCGIRMEEMGDWNITGRKQGHLHQLLP